MVSTIRRQILIRFDWAIREILRSEENFVILEGFLGELLKRNIKILNLLKKDIGNSNLYDERNHIGLIVESDDNEIILIEVYVYSEYEYLYEMLSKTTSAITSRYLFSEQEHSKIKKTYSVHILYFDFGDGKDYIYHGTTALTGLHENDELQLSKKQKEWYQKELIPGIYQEYQLIKVKQFNDFVHNTLDQWMYFLKNNEIKKDFNAKGLPQARKILNLIEYSDDDEIRYKRYLEDLRYQGSLIETREANIYFDGKDDGEKIGFESGRIEGKLETAKNMKSFGIDLSSIIKITGLTKEEIERL
jgi:predicted transposase/invertase (TIGR01784 family)